MQATIFFPGRQGRFGMFEEREESRVEWAPCSRKLIAASVTRAWVAPNRFGVRPVGRDDDMAAFPAPSPGFCPIPSAVLGLAGTKAHRTAFEEAVFIDAATLEV